MTARDPHPGDGGFTLAETIVSLGIIVTLCASSALLMLRSLSVDRQQKQAQAAIQVASAALERINQLPGDAVLALPATEAAADAPGLTQAFDVRACWQAVTGGPCTQVAANAQAGLLRLYRVTVTVTWSDRRCAGDTCAYVVNTLVSPTQDDPTFA